MKEFEERLLKRWLKRKVKITIATIVAFLIGSSLSLAETLYIRDGANGIEFSVDDQNWGENPYSENSFENGIYTNNRKIESDYIGIYNKGSNISLINENEIIVDGENVWGIYNNGTIEVLKNNSLLKVNGENQTIGIQNKSSTLSIINENKIIVDGENVWGIYNNGAVEVLKNNGLLEISGENQVIGIHNINSIGEIENKGQLYIKSTARLIKGIYNDEKKINSIKNIGSLVLKGSSLVDGIYNGIGTIQNIENIGSLYVDGESKAHGIYDYIPREENKITIIDIKNKGQIFVRAKERTVGIYNSISTLGNIENIGEIYAKENENLPNKPSDTKTTNGIYNSRGKIGSIVNRGIVKSVSSSTPYFYSYGINNHNENDSQISPTIDNIKNEGIIQATHFSSEGYGVFNYNGIIKNLLNYGVIGGSTVAIKNEGTTTNQENYGLLVNGAGTNNVTVNVGAGGEINNKFIINTIDKNNDYEKLENEQAINIEKINSKLNGKTNYKISDNSFKNLILNGYGTTLTLGGDLSLDNSIINGGLDEVSATIKGESGADNLALVNNTIINGNIDLGAGADKLSIDNTVQLNGDLLGGAGDDSLTFNPKGISTFGSEDDNNINIFNRVDGFENINVATDVTLFESAEVVGAGSIVIQKDGNLVLRIDSTNSNNHALSENAGTISSNGGKLLLALNGVGEGETISFGDTSLDETMKGNENGFKEVTIDTTSLLHNIKKIDNKTVKVTTEENIPYVNTVNYNELNRMYQSLRSIDGVGEFNVTDDKALVQFTNYLHDIYANNPYSFSSTLSRKSVNMFSDIVMDKDLHPEVNKWAIYGGLTHIDGGTKDTYYGKGYYTYDIGSKDIDVDSKITGMYAQGEYGVNETLNLGVIFGGNQSESEINGNSKVEGDSFYLGAYAKKYLGNLRLLAGVGYQYGDYKADRVAVGYSGITTTRTFDSNYNDNTFNIYAQAKYSNKLAENLYLEPSVALDYTYINQDGASEDGVLAIETDDKDFNYTTAKFGVDLRKDIPTTSATHSLVAGAYYNRMLDGYEEENITGRFVGGSDFDILVSPSNKHELGLRAKYEVELNNGVTFDVKGSYTFARESYSGENKNEHKGEWIVGVGIGYKF
jgi:hypothetical protein